jgi:5'-deoxynucleotidase YfbR-like HD superfamily hydrolase
MTVIEGPFGGSLSRETLEAFLDLNTFINEFKAVERSIEFAGSPGVERNAEHTYQVEFLALTLDVQERLGYDQLKLIFSAKFHDLVEWLEGDTPMFPDVYEGQPLPDPEEKRKKEERAYRALNERFGDRYPWMLSAIRAYLDQSDEESVFISALGKLIAVTNIYQDRGRSWRIRGIPLDDAYLAHVEGASKHPLVKALYERVWELIRADALKHPNLYAPDISASKAEERRRSE